MMRDQVIELERARSALWSLDAGVSRDVWVKHAMAAKAAGLDFETFHEWSAGAGNYKGESDCRSVWNSIKAGGIGEATLFAAARDSGWLDDARSNQPQRPSMPMQSRSDAPSAKPAGHDPAKLLEACKPASASHWYVDKKGGDPTALVEYYGKLTIAGNACDGALVLPARTLSGELASLQFITRQNKLFLPGRKLPADACFVVGNIESSHSIYIVEGIGQAWSANKATGCAAVVCFGWGRVAGVADALAKENPPGRLVIVPDGGKEAQAAEIARHVGCRFVELPPGTQSNDDINDLELSRGIEAVRQVLESTKSAPQRFQLLSPEHLAKLPPVRWRVRGVLPQEGIAAMYGPPGSGKSFLVLDLLAHVAGGVDWFGCRVLPAPVVYLALEGEAGIAQRVQAWQTKNGTLPDDFNAILQPLDIRQADDRAELIRAIKNSGQQGGILAVDTLNRAAPGADENSSEDMGQIISAAKELQAGLGGLVLLVHHSGKDAAKGLRGHSSLLAALDASVEVSRNDDVREWRIGKAKDGEDGRSHPFRLSVVELGTDQYGEPVTSCVCIPDDLPAGKVRKAKVPKGGNQKIVWDALGELFREAGSLPPTGAPSELPVGRPCLRLEDVIAKCRDRLAVPDDRKTERTRQAVTGLISSQLLTCFDGWLWCS